MKNRRRPASPSPRRPTDSTYRWPWILLAASLLWPTIAGLDRGRYYPFAFYILGNIVKPEAMPSFRDGIDPFRVSVFTIALFSNVAFALAPYLRRCATAAMSTRVLLFAFLAVDLSVAIVLPDFATAPGYWLWLAAIATIVWTFAVRQQRPQMPAPVAGVATVPPLIWIWLGWTVFWLAVTFADRLLPAEARHETIARARPLAPHPLTSYFNDQAHLFDPGDVARFNATLAQFEKDTTNQVAVAIYDDAPDGAIEDFTIRTADLSRFGRKGLDNGAILFVFAKPRLARLEIGYGLEPIVNDGKAGSRLDTAFVPAWQRGETVEAIDATLAALFEDVRDAYTGGKMPGPISVFARQLVVEIPKAVRGAWPAIRATPLEARLGIAFFGSFLGYAFFDGAGQAIRLLRNMARAANNLVKRRALTTGFQSVQIDSILDAVKVVVLFGVVIATIVSIVVVAGGGAFGGGGALRHW